MVILPRKHEPELGSPAPMFNVCMPVCALSPALRRRQVDPWGSLASQPSKLSELQVQGETVSKKTTNTCGLIEEDTQCHPLASTSTDIYVPFRTHAHKRATHTYTSSKFHVRKKALISLKCFRQPCYNILFPQYFLGCILL